MFHGTSESPLASPDLLYQLEPTRVSGISACNPFPLSHDWDIGKALIVYDKGKSLASDALIFKNTEADVSPVPIGGIVPLLTAVWIAVICAPKSIKNLVLVVLAWTAPSILDPEATLVNSNIWSIPVFCFGNRSYNVVSRSAKYNWYIVYLNSLLFFLVYLYLDIWLQIY